MNVWNGIGCRKVIALACLFVFSESVFPQESDHRQTPTVIKQPLKAHPRQGTPPRSATRAQRELVGVPGGIVKKYSGQHVDVLTYHYDNSRSGWNRNEVDLTPESVVSPQFSLLKSLSVDGNVFAQPLLISGFKMPDGQEHDVLVIATGRNKVYAFDANSFAPLWEPRQLGPPQQTVDINCYDVKPEYGISSTPVIVRSAKDSATLYVISATEPQKRDFHTFIHALDLTTGKDLMAPVEIAPSAVLSNGSKLGFDAQNQWSRAGLAYNNGGIFVSLGSHCDHEKAPISGWILKFSTNLNLLASFHTISAPKGFGGLASIWMTGFAPAIDTAGDLYVVTGNGDFSPPDDYGDSLLRLNPETLKVKDFFAPANLDPLPGDDKDFGSGGVILASTSVATPDKKVAIVVGKDPTLYLLDTNNLGKKQPNDEGALQAIMLKKHDLGIWGAPAAFGSEDSKTLFLQTQHDVLRAYSLLGIPKPSIVPSSLSGTSKAGYGGSIPIVSSDGEKNGIVWLLRRSSPIELEAYDASKLGAPLCSAHVGDWSNPDYGNSFLTPMVANGRVYAAAYNVVKIFGLADKSMTPPSSACSQATSPLRHRLLPGKSRSNDKN